MKTFLHHKLRINLIQQLELCRPSSVLLAFSGGQDSLCLLKLCIDMQNKYNFNIGIVHIDHQLRKDATINTNHIINIIKALQIKSYIYQIKDSSYSEQTCRDTRYQIILQTARIHGYKYIATAHSASDRIETFIYNLTRGSSMDGLNSIIWSRNINCNMKLIRPILNFTRQEIGWFCRYFALPVWSDYSNINYQHSRNRIRQELIPYLKKYLNKDAEKHITTCLELLYMDSEYIRQNTIKIYQHVKHPVFIAINHPHLLNQHYSIQIRVLRLFFKHNLNIYTSHILLKKIILNMQKDTKEEIAHNSIIIRYNKTWLYVS
uniref:tRNA(Ile)-lysidine synthase, chloroplastic n=1 Tax=Scinaia undulata TaxID=1884664 RepID=A0A1G4NXU7_9FLOR|nr:tRNA Ile-lysidine synthetase [Scinaia undulata]SCW23336.1 tRNA Ile-lysidine synthetase [Scinaia undulata]